jgi:hypothetical protein
MSEKLDLTGEIAKAINGAAARGHTIAISYIDDDGYPAVSFRGSIQVHNSTQLALWARRPSDGLARAITDRPKVTLVYYEPNGPGPLLLSIRGHAHIDADSNDAVYAGMIEGERGQDPDRNGVAVLIDVETVRGFGADGGFQLDA